LPHRRPHSHSISFAWSARNAFSIVSSVGPSSASAAGAGDGSAMIRREDGPALDQGARWSASTSHARGLLLSARPGNHSRDRSVRREGAGQPRLLSQQALWRRLSLGIGREIELRSRAFLTSLGQQWVWCELLSFGRDRSGDCQGNTLRHR